MAVGVRSDRSPSGGTLSAVLRIAWWLLIPVWHDEPAPLVVPADLDATRAPELHGDGSATCTGCDAVVPFDSMSIDERGYFCAGCSRAL